MAHFNKTMFCFERDGRKFGIRCEIYKFVDDWQELHSYDIVYHLYTYCESGGFYTKQDFDPSPDYIPVDNGHGIVNWLGAEEYQRRIRELYPDECESAKRLFIKEYFNI